MSDAALRSGVPGAIDVCAGGGGDAGAAIAVPGVTCAWVFLTFLFGVNFPEDEEEEDEEEKEEEEEEEEEEAAALGRDLFLVDIFCDLPSLPDLF